MIIVLDTNIWLKELALSTSVGAAFRFHMKQRSLRLAVPDVIRLEVKANLRRTISEAIEDISRGNRQLLFLFGSIKEILLPSKSEVESLTNRIFENLGVETFDIPFTLESAQSSLIKTIEKLPPSDKTQEFKDGVLWADCLRLLEQDEVLLVSQDKAFYLNREYSKGLADNLQKEAAEKPHKIQLVHSLDEILSQIEEPIPVDKSWLISEIYKTHTNAIRLMEKEGVEQIEEARIEYDLFATENPDSIYISYNTEASCTDIINAGRNNIKIAFKGNATLHLGERSPSGRKIIEERISFTHPNGTEDHVANNYLYASAIMGHRTIEHSVRHQLRGDRHDR